MKFERWVRSMRIKIMAKRLFVSVLCGMFFGASAGGAYLLIKDSTGYAQQVTIVDERHTGDDSTAKPIKIVDDEVRVISSDVSKVVEAKMPSIVSITNNFKGKYLFYSTDQSASGSGIIVGENDTELLIVTNYHVVEGADSLEVTFVDNEKIGAEIKGTNKDMDLAVIAVLLKDLKESTYNSIVIATLGDSDKLKVGEPVIAIGNSLGYGQSVTTGVVSALNREIKSSGKNKFIQTDAAINPGNSGGALLDINGDVIGINSNKIGGSTVEGMGYAIPISAARPIIEELMNKVSRPIVDEEKQAYLGIGGYTVSDEEAQYYGYPKGVYIAKVYEDTAAEAAGLKEGDIIVEFDGEEITSMEDLQKLLTQYEGGTRAVITYMREGNRGYRENKTEATLGYKVDA